MAVVGPLLVHPVREVQEVEVSHSVVMNALTSPFQLLRRSRSMRRRKSSGSESLRSGSLEADAVPAARGDSVTSGESSDWGEELEDFQPGRLGLSDSPHLVTWTFQDYPKEEQDIDSEEEDGQVETSEKKDPAWLRLSSDDLDQMLDVPGASDKTEHNRRLLRRSVSLADLAKIQVAVFCKQCCGGRQLVKWS